MSGERDKTLLRVVFCGSVDDGKSTLIGRLLADTDNIPSDQLEALAKDSRRFGTAGEAIDYALLVDGLQAEREQGITIDVAYRYFKTDRRSFIVADTPGHVQYTRNMATGASVSEVAVILIDARKGVLQQTRRHTCIAHLFGIRAVVAAVNKMDLVGYSEEQFKEIAEEYRSFAKELGVAEIMVIPIAARGGDNVVSRGEGLAWHNGQSLIEVLDTVNPHASRPPQPFRMPVQMVIRPDADHRAYAGTVASGAIRKGDAISIMPSGRMSTVQAISSFDGERMSAGAGDAVSLVLADDIDISRGDVISDPEAPPRITERVAARLVWLDDEPMIQGRQYIFKFGRQSVLGFVSALRNTLDIDDLKEKDAHQLAANDIGSCEIELSRRVVLESYADNRELGSFIVIDRASRATVAAGMVQPELGRASNLFRQRLDIGKDVRAAALRQRPRCVWFTGLSGAGKSTVANHLEARLHALGRHTYLLDGDNVRHGLNRDLGFSKEDRVENIRRVAEVAKLMVDAGLIVLVAFISPFRAERQMARELFEPGEFIEVFVDTPIEICAERDPKGLYRKASVGALKDFTGFDQAYEPPLDPEVRLRHAAGVSAADFSEQILASHFADLA